MSIAPPSGIAPPSSTAAAHTAAAPTTSPPPNWARRRPTPAELRTDWLFGLAALALSLTSMWLFRLTGALNEAAPSWLSALLLVAVAIAIGLRRRFVLSSTIAVNALGAISTFARVPETLILGICLFFSIFTMFAWSPLRRQAKIIFWCCVAVTLAAFVFLAIDLAPQTERALDAPLSPFALTPYLAFLCLQALSLSLFLTGAWYFGSVSWRAAYQRDQLRAQAAQLRQQQLELAEQAVLAERLRIARELHDAFAHHVSLMGIQAGAARLSLGQDPGAAAEALQLIETGSRNAIAELRGLLGTLREPEPRAGAEHPLVVEPVPTVAQIPQLVEETRALGFPVTFTVVGAARPLPATSSLNLFRIAQEALTNVSKHAGAGSSVDIRLRYGADSVEIEISNTGGQHRKRSIRPKLGDAQLGLIGMRERVESESGQLHVAELGHGQGFVVRATIPERVS